MRLLRHTPHASWGYLVLLLALLGLGHTPQAAVAAETDIVINEIHYDAVLSNEFVEFIELYNNGPDAVDLSGWTLSSAVDYTFPVSTTLAAGGYMVIAQADPNGAFTVSFQTRFGFAPAGEFAGKLANEGETITLRNGLGVKIDEVAYELGFPWPTTGYSVQQVSLQLINPALDNAASGNWRSAVATPGGGNTAVFATNAPPDVRKVSHTPTNPTSADDVLITAKITDPDTVLSVTLQLQLVDPGSYINLTDPAYATTWTPIAMNDAGVNGDLVAGDTIYSVTLDAATYQMHRRLVRYRIVATDGLSAAVTLPYADDPQPNFAYYVYNGAPNWTAAAKPNDMGPLGTLVDYTFGTLQPLPIYQLITKSTDTADAQFHPYSMLSGGYTGSGYLWSGTLVYDGVVYDHIHYRARGGVWRYSMGKNMWKFDFNKGHEFQARDDYGRLYDTTWSKLNFSAVIQQGNFLHRGEQGLFESVGFKLFNLTGVAAPDTHFVHFRVVDDAAETGPTQYDGDFWGMYLAIEQQDGNLLDAHGLPDGNLYKMESWTGELNNQGATAATNKSDLNAFVNAYGSGQTTVGPQQNDIDWWRTNFDLDGYYSYRSVVDAIHHYDIGSGKNYFYYLNPETNKWSVLPWDLDLTWANNMYIAWQLPNSNPPHNGVIIGGDPFHQRTIYNANIPAFNIEYQNRLREITDLLYNLDQAGRIIDEQVGKIYTAGNPSFVDADRARWDYNPLMIATTGNGYPRSYVNISKAGQGRYYQQPAGTTNDNFMGMVTLLKGYITSRTAWINSTLLTGENLIPSTPTLSFTGTPGYPSNQLTFQASAYSDPQGDAYAAVEWRLGRVRYPGIADYDPTKPWQYEIDAIWESGIITAPQDSINIPPGTVDAGKTYRARVRYQDNTGRWSHWSAAVEFTAADPAPFPANSLIITEFQYNPPGANDDLSYEFIELKNAYTNILDLSAVSVDGIGSFTFANGTQLAPGAFVVLAKNPSAFQTHYGFAPFNAMGYAGNLSNGGERITLLDSGGITITSVLYDDVAPWPTVPDQELGYSLVPINPNLAPDNAAAWRTSTSIGGSPGKDDPTLSAADVSVSEGDGTAVVLVSLSAATGQGITTTLSFSTSAGTATAPADFLTSSGVLTITMGQSITTAVPLVADNLYELTESFTVTLANNAGLADNTAVITITDDDPQPALSVADVTQTEGNSGSNNAVLSVTLSAPNSFTTTVDYATSDGTATAGVDYTAVTGTLTFAPSTTQQTISVPIAGDALYELDENFTLLLGSPTGHVTTADGQATGTIVNDDAQPSLNIASTSLLEANGTAPFTVTLSAASGLTTTVNYATADVSASAGADYTAISGTLTFAPGITSQMIAVPTADDLLDEPDETFTVALSNAANASVGQATAVGTILDNDATPSLSISDMTTLEGETAHSEPFTVTLSAASSFTITVGYATADVTAIAGEDYTAVSGTLTLAPGTISQTIPVEILGDLLDESHETISLSLSNPDHATLADGQATGRILDDDGAPELSISSGVEVVEGATAVFTVTLEPSSGQTVTVNYATADGTATTADYTPISGTLTFAPGQTSQTVVVNTTADLLNEPNETATLTLSDPVNAVLSTAVGTLTILDDDGPPALSVAAVQQAEGDAGSTMMSVTVHLQPASGQTVSVDFATSDDTAVAGEDYTAASGTLTFAPGQTSQTVAISITGDLVYEGDESFTITLSNATNATLDTASAVLGIENDDDAPFLSLSDLTLTEGSAGSYTVQMTATLSAASEVTATADFATADETATAGEDYTAVSGTLIFAPGQTSQSIVLTIYGDTLTEATESFMVQLTALQHAQAGQTNGRITLLDDDERHIFLPFILRP